MNYQSNLALIATLALAAGCGPKSETTTASSSGENASGPVVMDDLPPATVDSHAHPSEGPHNGKSSRFTLADAELVRHINDEAAKPKLMLTINGTPYRGEPLIGGSIQSLATSAAIGKISL